MWRRYKKYPCPAAMCEPMETAQSLGDDTHAVGTAAEGGHESTGRHKDCGSLRRWARKPGSSTGARHKDAGKHERKTPTPCERTGIQMEKEERKTSGSSEVKKLRHCWCAVFEIV